MTDERSYSTGELYDLTLSLKDATELGFARVDRRFADMEQRFYRVDERFDHLECRLIRIDDRLSVIENQNVAVRLQDHELRISRLEGRP
jgi:hypothetical protein